MLILSVGVSCQSVSFTPANTPPTPLAAFLQTNPASGATLSLLATLYAEEDSARLLETIVIADDGTPAPIGDTARQIWLPDAISNEVRASLSQAGNVQYGIVIARGKLVGPGTFGGQYRYQLINTSFERVEPLETDTDQLFGNPKTYQDRPIRLTSAIIVLPESALLVEAIGPTGVPENQARQFKMRALGQDAALLAILNSQNQGIIHYGTVEVSGLWDGHLFTPFSLQRSG